MAAAAAQEAEIILAQRLASNEKPVRTKALKMLRKYFNLRSQKAEGGFTSEDLLKIWKGLFYCLWMQDKPLLQEELSHRISGLIHSFHTTHTQLLYFATFLQTVKREWDGIDRLRMDKFFQLVRFMFRQVFEVLKRTDWETSVVDQFLKVFTEQLLASAARVPKGLMMHILDLYMTELAQVGSAELTAEQNLTFIQPFCKTMAKTKDRLLLTCISKNIFRTIVDHAPYAIEDLMRDLERGGEDSDSGQASGEEEEEDDMGEEDELKNNTLKKTNVKKVNGVSEGRGNGEVGTDDLDSDSVGSAEDDGVGAVLQFDYGAIADRLFELGSHMNTRNFNRTKMYNLVKTFRDLSEGVFPEIDEGESDESDECDASDDELFEKKSKKKKKRKSETAEEETVAKKVKAACPEDDSLKTARENLKMKPCVEQESDGEPQTETLTQKKTKKKNKKKKMNAGDTESRAQPEEKRPEEKQPEEKRPEEISEDTDACGEACSMSRKKKRKNKKPCSSSHEVVEDVTVQIHHAQKVVEDNRPTQNHLETAQTKKAKRKNHKSSLQKVELPAGTLEDPDKPTSEELDKHLRPTSEEDLTTRLKGSSTKNKKSKMSSSQEVDAASHDCCADNGAGDTPAPAVQVLRSKKGKKIMTPRKLQVEPVDAGVPEASSNGVHVSTHDHDACCQPQSVKKAKKKKQRPEPALEAAAVEEEACAQQAETPRKKKKIQKKQKAQSVEEVKEEPVVEKKAGAEEPHDDVSTPVKKGKKKRKLQTDGAGTPQRNTHAEEAMSGKKIKVSGGEVSTPVTQKKLKMDKASAKSDFVSFQGLINPPTPLFCKTKSQPSTPRTSIKAKFLTPKSETKKVTFGLKNNKTAEFRKMDRSLLVSPVGSSRVAFDPKKMPVSGVLKSPSLSPVISMKKPAAKKRATAADFF
ncbi:ribosomal RNA processing protein 1 homolog B isoform X2 [Clarias gariepinus]|uniref:ribosomal RNA processing protein 1 homolog B isoform X2 n=1 Tax=Clarias gariepinus TaxID=13013 RepID=UPI00234D5310|nr:ribosomal RNA processing protein 1 homolog B isoform X2 [Clarias gariepinus]